MNGGALYARDCPHYSTITSSIFLRNSAGLSGGALFFEGVNFDLFTTNINFNSALIGGGVKYAGIIPKMIIDKYKLTIRRAAASGVENNPSINKNNISFNDALIFGNDMASYIGGVNIL